MSDRGKFVVHVDTTTNDLILIVKRAAANHKRAGTVKIKVPGQRPLHVSYNPKDEKLTWREGGVVSCSPAVIAQAIFAQHLEKVDWSKVVTRSLEVRLTGHA
jgi:hypothetical protein